jgi:outer membrane protein TolC
LTDSVYALGSGLTAPIFNAGRISAQITAADARLEQVAIHYEKMFLLAIEEVENAFVAYRTALSRQTELIQAETASDKAFRDTESLYKQGVTTHLPICIRCTVRQTEQYG